jgi:DNA-binding Lrp family transcriptional regulator|tara:strand:+ start:54713 stop:54964 length:252 start_codon:yes stop_codon:yes gene_type:complete
MVSLRYHHEGFIDKFETQIKALDEIQECYHMAGKVDFFLKLNLQSIAEYHEFVRSKLSKIEKIGVLESYFVLKEMFHTTEFHI